MKIENLKAGIEDKQILNSINLAIKPGEVHAIMGPNGSGKSTLAQVLAGNPKYSVEGSVRFYAKDILKMTPDERSKQGIFLAFQHPIEIPGLNLNHFLFSMAKSHDPKVSAIDFHKNLNETADLLGINPALLKRQLNVDFSGGEKKRIEILQMLLLKPHMAILDETDSGLDVDSLKVISAGVNSLRDGIFSALIITHYPKILHEIKPDKVHILVNGKIVETGDFSLALEVEKDGYGKWC